MCVFAASCVATMVLALVAGGCGGHGSSTNKTFTTGQVISAVKEKVNETLVFVPSKESDTGSALDFGPDKSYGYFVIGVLKGNRDNSDYQIGSVNLASARPGVVIWSWEGPLWVATKVYGRNVSLTYFTDLDNRNQHPAHPSGGWILLDEALSSMAGEPTGGGNALHRSVVIRKKAPEAAKATQAGALAFARRWRYLGTQRYYGEQYDLMDTGYQSLISRDSYIQCSGSWNRLHKLFPYVEHVVLVSRRRLLAYDAQHPTRLLSLARFYVRGIRFETVAMINGGDQWAIVFVDGHWRGVWNVVFTGSWREGRCFYGSQQPITRP
jgi:hypothetical protein